MINTKFLEGYEELNLLEPKNTFRVEVNAKPSFNELMAKESPFSDLNYIGSGNMNADMLIIGKEMAIDLKDENNEKRCQKENQYKYSVLENTNKWRSICEKGYATITHADTEEKRNNYHELFSPVFPYYRQQRKINIKERNNGGTSRTEFGYQKLIENIYNDGKPFAFFNLHEYVFLSELSTEVASMSNKVAEPYRLKSLKDRRILWNTDFFKSFPITILAVGHYIDIKENGEKIIKIDNKNVEGSCFDIKFYAPTIQVGKKFINVHFTEDAGGKERMLLHTNQLSFYSNDLIGRLGELCKTFLNDGKDATMQLVDKLTHR